MSLVKRYRESRTRQVELPSVLSDGTHPVFTIRKIPRDSVLKIAEILGLTGMENPEVMEGALKTQLSSPEYRKRMVELMNEILIDCVVEPKLGREAGEDTLSVSELDFADQIKLFREILSFSGVSLEAEERRNL